MIRIAVADDQALVRMGLAVLVDAEDDLELVGEAPDGPAALDLIRHTRPDVALLDIRMPGLDGIGVLERISAEPALGDTHVIMLTTFEDDEYVFAALRAGAAGFLLKDGDTAQLLRAVRTVAAGEALLSPSVTLRVVRSLIERSAPARNPHPRIAELTAREREVVALVAEGLSNDDIARRFVLSPATVRTHVGRAMVKLAARDRAQLVVFAYQSGLVA